MMLYFIKEIVDIQPYKIICIFNSGEKREINLAQLISAKKKSLIYQQLTNKDYFKTVKLDSYGTLCWDNRLDFCPDVLFAISLPIL